MSALIISHSGDHFTLRRHDGDSRPPVTLPTPYTYPVANLPNSNLMLELRWYLEKFLDYPYDPDLSKSTRVLKALQSWGTEAFQALFAMHPAGVWLDSTPLLQIRSNDPQVLSWPWEALYDPLAGTYVAHNKRVERCLNQIADPNPLGQLPTDRVNILLVVSRPFPKDVRFRSIARPLIELIKREGLPAHVDVLRPPTFDQLRAHLKKHPNHYHVLHFDGHGTYGAKPNSAHPSPHTLHGAAQGHLYFETATGDPDPKSARDLSILLRDHAVPAVVLNACQSAMLAEDAEGAFSSVATALLQSGMRSVVAMAYSLYVTGAQAFLPAFYKGLFESGDLAEAVRAGRQQMLANPERRCSLGLHRLEDWLLPVLYQRQPINLKFAAQAQPQTEPPQSRLPDNIRDHRDEYGFIGRDGPILSLERALHRNPPAILIQGLGGVGKTTLARGFLRWLDDTGGLDAAFWFDFRDIRSSEHVLNRTGEAFYGENFGGQKDKIKLLAQALSKHRAIIVWDNFESTATNLPTEDRAELARLLDALRGLKSKVIITSRAPEDWLNPSSRSVVKLGGLDGEERWEFCDTILRDLGLKINRTDPDLAKLMDYLAGHPLAMRVILPKLESMSASSVRTALTTNLVDLGPNQDEEQSRLFATLRFVEQGLPEDLKPLLDLLALHESYVEARLLELMAKQVDSTWTKPLIDRFLSALESAGLLRDIGDATFEMHPLLITYLRFRQATVPAPCQRAFVDIMATLASALAPKPLHEQRVPFLLHGSNFNYALALSEQQAMEYRLAALTQALAIYAQNTRAFDEAARLFQRRADHGAAAGNPAREASAYHQLGIIAQEQRDFLAARDWYLKSLTIKEKHGDLHHAAITYHQLGKIAQEQRDFPAARDWCLKSLAISEKQGNLDGAANTYHQLGIIAQEQRDFLAARDWYLKSLAIKEKQGNLHHAASTYHNLGMIAEEQRDFLAARDWYLKSLTVKEKQGNLHGAALTYHQLGRIAEEQRDFHAARDWYLKSLAIKEKQGNLHGAAFTYSQLGILSGLQKNFVDSARWFVRCAVTFLQQNDPHEVQRNLQNFLYSHSQASPQEQQQMEAIWREAGLGDFPPPTQPT